jgi:hypothetical protein
VTNAVPHTNLTLINSNLFLSLDSFNFRHDPPFLLGSFLLFKESEFFSMYNARTILVC